MTLTRKILVAVGGLLAAAIVSLAIALSYDAECGASPLLAAEAPRMRAIVRRCYGSADVLEVEEVEKPTPADDQILVKVHAVSVNPADWYGMTGRPYVTRIDGGIGAPESPRLGIDYAGSVEAVGERVTRFEPGDEVFGARNGAFAEYLTAREDRGVVLKPDRLTFEQAAAVPVAALTALQGLRDTGGIEAGQKVLINGASGGVGTFAVQIARSFGAHVTGVCSTRNVELVRSLGADRVIDYTRENFTEGDERYDLILDNVGNHSFSALRRVLTPKGTYVMVGGSKSNPFLGPLGRVIRLLIYSKFVDQKFAFFISELNPQDLALLADLMQAGKVTPVIDRTYAFEELPEAMRYLAEGHARAKIAVTVSGG